MKKFFSLFLVVLMTTIALSGCGGSASVPTPTPIPGAAVLPEFLPTYAQIAQFFPGGLGRAQKPPENMGTFTRQIFEKGVLVYDPGNDRVALQPVGYQQRQPEPPTTPAEGPGWVQIQGYWVPPAIAKTYNALGSEVMGEPLSNYRYNPDQQRYEMYFANLGIYTLPNDPLEQVYLLPYGNWVLANESILDGESTPFPRAIIQNATEAFDELASRTDKVLTGEQLAAITTSPEGQIIRVYTNAIMVWNAEENKAEWMNLPERMGVVRTSLVEELQNDNTFFVPLQGRTKGHNVPNKFWDDFLALHGGFDAAGYPITELVPKTESNGQVVQQCYEHICLEFNYDTGEITPVPFGEEFYRKYGSGQHPQNGSPPLKRVVIETTPAHPLISPRQPQQVRSRIQIDGQPAPNVSPSLILHLPAGQVEFSFPPTNAQGEAVLDLPPLAEGNGTKVMYEVCLTLEDGSRPCASGQFVIAATAP